MAKHPTATGQAVIRAYRPGIGLRANGDGSMPTLHGHFAVFNRWTEIDSWMEGHFMERIAPGAFKKTFQEQTPKVLFQHGQDPQVGDKPLGPIETLSEDGTGAAYEVQLLDTSYNRDLLPGLEAGLYGASFRFKVMREEIEEEPRSSADNPDGLPERTIAEARVMEFGPVTFPAYAGATAGVRSLTDRFLFDAIERDPGRARELLRTLELGSALIVAADVAPTSYDAESIRESFESVLGPIGADRNEGKSEDESSAAPSHTSTPSQTRTPGNGRRADSDTSDDAERRDEATKKTWQQVLSEEDRDAWIPRI